MGCNLDHSVLALGGVHSYSLTFYLKFFSNNTAMNIREKLEFQKLSPEELLKIDVKGLRKEMKKYRQLALQADRVVITIICCDSREVFPAQLVPKQMIDETGKLATKQILFIQVPTIGSGAPSRTRVREVFRRLVKWGVSPDKIDFCVTQHADSQELEQILQHQSGIDAANQPEHISCGLRHFFQEHEVILNRIRDLLLAWTYTYKGKHGKKAAPDRLPLSVLYKEASEVMKLVDQLHVASGEEGFRLPRRLIIRAAYRNSDFSLSHNSGSVFARLSEYLNDSEWERVKNRDGQPYNVRETSHLLSCSYDHQQKILHFNNYYAAYGVEEKVSLPDVPPRTDSVQKPEYVTISFGPRTIPYAVNQLFPQLCGQAAYQDRGIIDNAFRTVASIPSVPTLLVAMAEAAYAVIHKVRPHGGNKNFESLKRVVIVCDSQKYVDVVHQMLQDPEYQEEYQRLFRALHMNLLVVNLNLDTHERPIFTEVAA